MTDATLTGAPAEPAAAFQALYDSGAFSTDGKTIPDDAETRTAPDSGEKPLDAPKAAPKGEDAAKNDTTSAKTTEDAEGKPADEAATGEEKPYTSLEEFLTENKLDPAQFNELPVTVKIDGETRSVPLKDVIKSFQLEGHVNNKSMELSNAKRAFEAEQQQVRDVLKQQIDRNEALGGLAVQQLQAEFQRIDWNGLRTQDPGQYAALMADFQQRNQQIQGFVQQVQQQKAQEAQVQQQQLNARIPQEKERVLEARPEWRDPAVYRKDHEQIVAYAKNSGFTDAELNSLYDSRYLLTLHDAARYRALQAAKPAATKLVREAPKMAKPGTRTNRDPKQVASQQALERFQRNPKDIDSQAAYFETLTE
jgi:hypothetical protein